MDREARVRVLDPKKRGGKWVEEREGEQVRVVVVLFSSRGHGSVRRRAAWRHSAANVATVAKMTHRYYRRSMTGSTGQSIKTEVCYFIWALKQPQKFYKNSERLSTT